MFVRVLDCGLFHTFDGGERPGYVASLASVTHEPFHAFEQARSIEAHLPGTGAHIWV